MPTSKAGDLCCGNNGTVGRVRFQLTMTRVQRESSSCLLPSTRWTHGRVINIWPPTHWLEFDIPDSTCNEVNHEQATKGTIAFVGVKLRLCSQSLPSNDLDHNDSMFALIGHERRPSVYCESNRWPVTFAAIAMRCHNFKSAPIIGP